MSAKANVALFELFTCKHANNKLQLFALLQKEQSSNSGQKKLSPYIVLTGGFKKVLE